jgi:hypothetical protein
MRYNIVFLVRSVLWPNCDAFALVAGKRPAANMHFCAGFAICDMKRGGLKRGFAKSHALKEG